MFGPVQDVRIPYQQKRMFGFVTFVYAETVKAILSKGNPHFVCDARVLVKPYKEKGKVPDRFRSVLPSSPLHIALPLPACACIAFSSFSLQSHCNALHVALLVCFDSFRCHLKKASFFGFIVLSGCRKLQHTHHGGAEFVGCASPTGLLDSRDPYDLQQPQIGEWVVTDACTACMRCVLFFSVAGIFI
jgi:hypothetical protein